MHRIFQRDLCKLRLTTARAFVKVATESQGPLSVSVGAAIRLLARVAGLGPVFRLKLQLTNSGSKGMCVVGWTNGWMGWDGWSGCWLWRG